MLRLQSQLLCVACASVLSCPGETVSGQTASTADPWALSTLATAMIPDVWVGKRGIKVPLRTEHSTVPSLRDDQFWIFSSSTWYNKSTPL